MYDPARDIFQPPPAEAEGNEETVADDKVPRNVNASESSSVMASATGQKRQRSPSPAVETEAMGNGGPETPPNKKRRSSVEPIPPPSIDETKATTRSSCPSSADPIPLKSEGVKDAGPDHQQGRSEAGRSSDPGDGRQISRSDPTANSSPARVQANGKTEEQRTDHTKGRHSADRDERGGQQARADTRRRPRPPSASRQRPPAASNRSAYSRRDPPPARRRSRSPSPIRRSPPREDQSFHRPGGGTGRGRNVLAIQQRLAEEREREQEAQNAQMQRERGVQHVSNLFYNARPEWVKERGRDWRKNESKIKGLRAFNNWIKSCIIQKFSPEEAPQAEELGWGEEPKAPAERAPLLVLDIGCGKGGDLGKWQLAPQKVGLYVGLDPADQSIAQARDRYGSMRRGRKPIFDGRFYVKDCFGEWIGEVPIVGNVGIDAEVGTGGVGGPSRWGGGGFDVVSMMFSMHYAFESEHKARTMLRNVAGSLKKGGRFIGVVPNSDAISERVVAWWKARGEKKASDETGKSSTAMNGHGATVDRTDGPEAGTSESDRAPSWGNSLYHVCFADPASDPSSASSSQPAPASRPTPHDGIFRNPPYGWKYMYWMSEAVDVPEYVVPWEAFRALAEQFNLEQRYRKAFLDVWAGEVGPSAGSGSGSGSGSSDKDEMRRLAIRMGVLQEHADPRTTSSTADNQLRLSPDEREAVGFYHAFCFVKV